MADISTMLRSACAVPSVRWKLVLKLMPTLVIVACESSASPSFAITTMFFDDTPGSSARLLVCTMLTSKPSTLNWRLFEAPALRNGSSARPRSLCRRSTPSSSCDTEPRMLNCGTAPNGPRCLALARKATTLLASWPNVISWIARLRRVMSEMAEIIMSRVPTLTFLVESDRSSMITLTSRVP